jgi:hypothetical protein
VELRGEYVEYIHIFIPVACCFLYRAKDVSAPPRRLLKGNVVISYCVFVDVIASIFVLFFHCHFPCGFSGLIFVIFDVGFVGS